MRGNGIITAGPVSASPIKPAFGGITTVHHAKRVLRAQNLGNSAVLEVFTAAQTLRFWEFKSLFIDKNWSLGDEKCWTHN